MAEAATLHCQGLSPLARGNRPAFHDQVSPAGPIPARAGEPSGPGQTSEPARAYPRSRGGTDPAVIWPIAERGLSPLARGNQPAPLE
jgi:hypothetical protein